MQQFSKINNWQLLKSFKKRISGLRSISVFLFFVTLAHGASNWKSLNLKISREKKRLDPQNIRDKKLRIGEIPTQKTLNPHHTQEKEFLTRRIPMKKFFGPAKYPKEKISDPQNTHEKKFGTHKISTRKKFSPTKYARRHDGTIAHSGCTYITILKKINNSQKHVIWIIYNKRKLESTPRELQKQNKILNIDKLNILIILVFMHKITKLVQTHYHLFLMPNLKNQFANIPLDFST